MNRFYVSKGSIKNGVIEVTDREDVHHLVKVLRVKAAEELCVSDGEGTAYIVQVAQTQKAGLSLRVVRQAVSRRRENLPVRLVLGCAVAKNTSFEDVVDKATQLGIDEIVPLETDRTVARHEVIVKKTPRFQRVMLAAAKQSGALFLPRLRPVMSLDAFLQELGRPERDQLRLIPNLSCRPLPLKDAVAPFPGGRVVVLIGPEGDFSDREISLAQAAGFQGVSLGESVLRVDTAATAVLSYLRLHFGL